MLHLDNIPVRKLREIMSTCPSPGGEVRGAVRSLNLASCLQLEAEAGSRAAEKPRPTVEML